VQNQYNRNKSVNYYQGYHNTTRKNYHQKNDIGLKKPTVQGSGFKGSRFQSNINRRFLSSDDNTHWRKKKDLRTWQQ
jgi:hypothetical protein